MTRWDHRSVRNRAPGGAIVRQRVKRESVSGILVCLGRAYAVGSPDQKLRYQVVPHGSNRSQNESWSPFLVEVAGKPRILVQLALIARPVLRDGTLLLPALFLAHSVHLLVELHVVAVQPLYVALQST